MICFPHVTTRLQAYVALRDADPKALGSALWTMTIPDLGLLSQVAVQEARRLQRFGVTQAEADTYRQATLRDNFMASLQADYVPAQEILEFLMETLATRSVFSDNNQVSGTLAL